MLLSLCWLCFAAYYQLSSATSHILQQFAEGPSVILQAKEITIIPLQKNGLPKLALQRRLRFFTFTLTVSILEPASTPGMNSYQHNMGRSGHHIVTILLQWQVSSLPQFVSPDHFALPLGGSSSFYHDCSRCICQMTRPIHEGLAISRMQETNCHHYEGPGGYIKPENKYLLTVWESGFSCLHPRNETLIREHGLWGLFLARMSWPETRMEQPLYSQVFNSVRGSVVCSGSPQITQ